MINDDELCMWLESVVVFAGVATALTKWDALFGLRVAGVMTLWALIMYAIWRRPNG